MKIGNSPEKLASTAVATERHGGTAEAGRSQATAGAKKAPEASAQVALSKDASHLVNGVSDEGSFDAEKVNRIAKAISEGKFSVNADAIADKLIANAQEMLNRASAH